MPKPPTKKQLRYLKGLGYAGTPPETSGEASTLIDDIKSGMKPAEAERGLLNYRKGRERKRLEQAEDSLQQVKDMLKWMDETNAEYRMYAGFRLVVDKQEAAAETLIYHRAFLPLDVARKYPELLLLAGLNYDNELERAPHSGKFVVSPGQIVERSKSAPARKSSGCAVMLFLVIVLTALAVIFYHWQVAPIFAWRA